MDQIGTRPNILLIMADQLAPQFLPCHGHPIVKAPTIDALGREGVVFDNAYTNSPLCAPSRFVMMSGRQPSRISAWDNASEFAAEVPTFAHYLSDAGYDTCLSGKMHFVGPDQLHGFDRRLTTDVYPADFGWHPEWDRPDARLDWFHNMEVVTRAGSCVRSMYLDYDDEAVFQARRYLFDRAREDQRKPFMLVVSMIQPHDPYLCPEAPWGQYENEEIDLPKIPYGSVPEDPHSARLRFAYGATDIDLDDAVIRRARRAYYGAISDIDAKVQSLLEAVRDSGEADNTIVIFTADHGDMLGERGLWFKMSFFEHSARVPLIFHAPNRMAPRRVSDAVSLVDLLPTLVDLAGGRPDAGYVGPIEGRSLVSHLDGDTGHDEVIGEYFGEGAIEPVFMIRRGQFKLIYSRADPVQFYDLDTDPEEEDNLAIKGTPPKECREWLDEIHDRYDQDRLRQSVLESQRRRRLIKKVMGRQAVSWDYQPATDASNLYVRSGIPIYDLEKRSRFPRD